MCHLQKTCTQSVGVAHGAMVLQLFLDRRVKCQQRKILLIWRARLAFAEDSKDGAFLSSIPSPGPQSEDHTILAAQKDIARIEAQSRELGEEMARNQLSMRTRHARSDASLHELQNFVLQLREEHEHMVHIQKHQAWQTGQTRLS